MHTFRYEQIAHDTTCDAWSMDRSFTVFIRHNLEPDGDDFERTARSRDAIACGRVDPQRGVGSVSLSEDTALDPVLDRLRIAFPGIRWYAFSPEPQRLAA